MRFMTAGAFAVLASLTDQDGPRENYSDFAGLGFKRPFLAAAMSLFMLSLAGFPPLAGFTGKFYIFRSAILAGHTNWRLSVFSQSLVGDLLSARCRGDVYGGGRRRRKSFRQSPYSILPSLWRCLEQFIWELFRPGPSSGAGFLFSPSTN